MPYIKQESRKKLDAGAVPEEAGELNYVLSRECMNYLGRKGVSYGSINEVIGVLACAQAELYRIVAAEYEDDKREVNGGLSALNILDEKK